MWAFGVAELVLLWDVFWSQQLMPILEVNGKWRDSELCSQHDPFGELEVCKAKQLRQSRDLPPQLCCHF